MFLILNRLRGTYGWFAKVNGVVLGLLFYLAFGNPYVSLAVTIGYVLGESFGWGDWFSIYDFATRGLNGSTSNQHGSSSWCIV